MKGCGWGLGEGSRCVYLCMHASICMWVMCITCVHASSVCETESVHVCV